MCGKYDKIIVLCNNKSIIIIKSGFAITTMKLFVINLFSLNNDFQIIVNRKLMMAMNQDDRRV